MERKQWKWEHLGPAHLDPDDKGLRGKNPLSVGRDKLIEALRREHVFSRSEQHPGAELDGRPNRKPAW